MTYGITMIVGRLHVRTSNREVLRYVRSRLAKGVRTGLKYKALRKRIYREALKAHAANRKLYNLVQRGLA